MNALKAPAALALMAVLFGGCDGGGATPARVEASLQDYFSGLPPGGSFPVDAGPPRIQHNSCKDRHVTTKSGQVVRLYNAGATFQKGLALWSCAVTFRNDLILPVDVVVKDSKVVGAFARAAKDSPRQSPATVYEGGPEP